MTCPLHRAVPYSYILLTGMGAVSVACHRHRLHALIYGRRNFYEQDKIIMDSRKHREDA